MSFVDAVLDALEQPNAADSTSAVHTVVGNALHQIDPNLRIQATDYFTHSFVPDLVLRWRHGDETRERHVHLRFSVSDDAFPRDVRLLADQHPLFMGLTDIGEHLDAAPAARLAAETGSLITATPTIGAFERASESDRRTRAPAAEVLRDGRGAVDERRADGLAGVFRDALRAIDELEAGAAAVDTAAIAHALDALAEVLPESGLASIERSLQSLWIRSGGDPFEFPGRSSWDPERLSWSELGEVLNSLLDSSREIPPEVWVRNAGFLRAEDIGKVLRRDWQGGQFNALVHALLPNWTAQWVWAERQETLPLFEEYVWLVSGEVLGLQAADLRIFFADDGRHFKDKPGGQALPTLAAAREQLSDPGVIAIGLTGGRDGLVYRGAGTSGPSTYESIQALLAEPVAERYRVNVAVVQTPGHDWTARLDFSRLLIDVDKRPTPVATLARLAFDHFSNVRERRDALDHFIAG